MNRTILFPMLLWFMTMNSVTAQNPVNDPEAAALLQKVSAKYKSYQAVSASFKLLVVKPKVKPTDDERKLTDTISGTVLLQGPKFALTIRNQEIICDGKNIWTYMPDDKEVQLNYFEETDDIFSPSKIFTLYQEGYSYQIRERKAVKGKSFTVIEMSPASGKKTTFFKIDVTVDETDLQVTESKIYEKNGVRYIYKLTAQKANPAVTADMFTFDVKKHPGVKLVDLR